MAHNLSSPWGQNVIKLVPPVDPKEANVYIEPQKKQNLYKRQTVRIFKRTGETKNKTITCIPSP